MSKFPFTAACGAANHTQEFDIAHGYICLTCAIDKKTRLPPRTGHDVFIPAEPPIRLPPTVLPTDAKARKDAPMDRGLLKYFPRALAYVAEISRVGNEQHNPGQPMHWSRDKSSDHGDCIVRHQCEAGTIDSDGMRHSGKVAWRALAQLELELEAGEKK